MEHKRHTKNIMCLTLVLPLIVILVACSNENAEATYSYSETDGVLVIEGYDATRIEYTSASQQTQGFLYFVNPKFLGDYFASYTVEGGAEWDIVTPNIINVYFTSSSVNKEDQVMWKFSADLDSDELISWTGSNSDELTTDEMLRIARKLGEILNNAEAYYAQQHEN